MGEFDDASPTAEVAGPLRTDGSGPNERRNRAYLIVLAGSGVGEMYKVGARTTVIGRGHEADIRLIDEGVSRRHLEIEVQGSRVFVQDLRSRNGTYCNGTRVDRTELSDGDKILVGSTSILKFTYHDALDEEFQRQMYESALRDALTRVFNRRYFLDRLESELAYALRHAVPMSLILFDIDHFKKINDTLGHPAGDEVLTQIAARVAGTIRAEDVLARFGGEEFAVICRGIDNVNGALVGERLRRAVEGQPFSAAGKNIDCTISVGVVSLPDLSLRERDRLIAAADEALYQAKDGGRNRVVVKKAA